jgi:hypothetical protein
MEDRAKSYACLTKSTSSQCFARYNSEDWMATARAKQHWGMQQKDMQDETRMAMVHGDKHKAARNLSRACTAGVHTKRPARASRVMGWIDLLFG